MVPRSYIRCHYSLFLFIQKVLRGISHSFSFELSRTELGWVMGFEPTNGGTTIRCLNRLATPTKYGHRSAFFFILSSPHQRVPYLLYGAADGVWTRDLLNGNQMLYQLSHSRIYGEPINLRRPIPHTRYFIGSVGQFIGSGPGWRIRTADLMLVRHSR